MENINNYNSRHRYESELEYLNYTSLEEGSWKVLKARTHSRCKHCGDAVTKGEPFFWHPDSGSIHIDCVELMQALEHAMNRAD